jgi:UDP-3-O-acyl-N-acetylglucosamine deacetylase
MVGSEKAVTKTAGAINGIGPFSGAAASITLAPHHGEFVLRRGGRGLAPRFGRGGCDKHASYIEDEGFGRLATTEHFFAALSGNYIFDGVAADVAGEELPVAGGSALAYVDLLADFFDRDQVGMFASREELATPQVVVTREAEFRVGHSVYSFRPASDVSVSVEFVSPDPRFACAVQWDGKPITFNADFAHARTFAFEVELEQYAAMGIRVHIAPQDVVILGPTVYAAGRPFEPSEPARHKLCDLLGDLYSYGGPPLGELRAVAPGHAANHQAFQRAKREGILAMRR